MKIPKQVVPILRSDSSHLANAQITPQDCGLGKKIACSAAVVACAVTCAAGPEACAACFAGLGMSSCIDCA